MSDQYRLRLDKTAFSRLVSGQVVHARIHGVPVEVVLDMPWPLIAATVILALPEHYPQLGRSLDPPQAREFLPRRK